LREQAKKAISKIQEENSRVYNRKRKKPNIYKIGDLVAIKRTQFAPGSKLCAKYLGPYEIVTTKGKDRYNVMRVGEHEGPLSTTTAADCMKPWILTDSDISDDDTMSDTDIDKNKDIDVNGYQGLITSQDGRTIGSQKPMFTRARAAALRAVTT